MVIPAAIISSMLGSLNGFILAKWKFRGADFIFPFILFGMFIPYQSILIPLVQFMNAAGITGLPGFALALTGNTEWPITVALNNMAGSQIIAWNVQMAGSLLAALPTLLVYIFLGQYFLRGLLAGSLKG